MNGRRLVAIRLSVVSVTFLLLVAVCAAQLSTATLLGTVTDSSGAVVPGATLTTIDLDTGQSRTVSTNSNGEYRFSALPVGNYQLKVEHEGFKSDLRTGLVLTVAQEATVNFALEVGTATQTVAVTSEAPLVNTANGSLGSLVNENSLEDLPVNGRNYIALTLMQPGVVQHMNEPQSVYNTGQWFSSNGAPLTGNNFLLDGAILQDLQGASSASLAGATLGMDGIKEYRVITSNFKAEYGMTMGSQTVMASKGGTNNFHGTAFDYFRSDVLDARNYFDYPTPASRGRRLPAFTRNDFGGSFGGPIQKNKTFFFGVFEGLRQRLGITNIENGIPLAYRVNGGLVPQISPVIQPFLQWFPVPNLPNNQFSLPVQQVTNDEYGQMRVDRTFSASDNVFVRFTIQDETQATPSSTVEGDVTNGRSLNEYSSIGWNHIFSPNLLNTFTASLSQTGNVTRDSFPSALASPATSLTVNSLTGVLNPPGSISIGGYTGIGISYPNTTNGPQHIWSFADDLIYTHGRHALKFGTLINFYNQPFIESVGQYGSLTFGSLTGFLQNQPISESADITGHSQARDYHSQTYGFYGQDDYTVTSRLTINYGLRYEFYTTPSDILGHNDALRNRLTDQFLTPGPIMLNPSLHDFSPRFGFAWDVFGNGKMAVRGGADYLYDIADLGSALVQDATGKPPYNEQSLVNNPGPITSLPLTLPAADIGTYMRQIEYHYGQPHAITYNLSVERELPFNMLLTVAYTGLRGLSLANISEGNPVIPGGIPTQQAFNGSYYTGTCVPRTASQPFVPNGPHCWLGGESRENPYWGTMTLEGTYANSKYNAGEIELTKRLSKGLQFQNSFTWSKNLVSPGEGEYNNQNVGKSPFASDPTNPERDYGPAVFDAPYKWDFNLIYNLPKAGSLKGLLGALANGWWTSTIIDVQSGYPFSPTIATNRDLSQSGGSGVGTDQLDLLPSYNIKDLTTGTVQVGCGTGSSAIPAGTPVGNAVRWFNPCAFALPPVGFIGTVGQDIMRGPGFADADVSFVKDTPVPRLGEGGAQMEFRVEIFNILNHANFALPNRTVFTGALQDVIESPLPTAGQITSTVGTSRQIQLALRLVF